jgi:uncharacterized protein (DUF2252 family)
MVMTPVKSPARQRKRAPSWPAPGTFTPKDERAAMGKAARALVPRESHSEFDPPPDRPDPIDLLEEQARTRLPDLVPVRYGRMLVSPFAFFRGAALPMASDLSHTPVTGLTVQACGDAHLSNFGVFGSPERRLVFDVNDFDETLPGPWEWDVKRLTASLEVAARQNSFPVKRRRKIVLAAVASYRTAMQSFAGMNELAVWYARADLEQLRADYGDNLSARQRNLVDRGMATARTRDSMQATAKLTQIVDGRPRLVADPPLVVPIADLLPGPDEAETVRSWLHALLGEYRRTVREDSAALLGRFEFADMARKVVGVGSVGTRCWIVLMLGGGSASDPLLLQVKEAQESVLSRFAGPSEYANQGQRVVVGQRFTQAASDIFLGWLKVTTGMDGKPHDYYVRQLRDWKLSLDITTMVPKGMQQYATLCGWTLARAHARTGDRIAIAAYLGGSDVFDNAVADFAERYADQTERDYQGLVSAVSSGRIKAESGV